MKLLKIILSLFFTIILIISGVIFYYKFFASESTYPSSSLSSSPLQKPQENITFTVSPTFITPALTKYPPPTTTISSNHKIKGAIVPHHDLASDLIAEALQKVAETQKPKRIILIGPNHLDLGSTKILTTKAIWQAGNLHIFPDEEVIQKLVGRWIATIDNEVLAKEHSIFTILPFIHHYFPDTKLVPLILNSKLDLNELFILSDRLQSHLDNETLVIASIDFSHYLPSHEVEIKDQYTKQLILSHNYERITQLNDGYTDSPPSLNAILKTMELVGATSTTIVRNTNSGALLGRPVYSSTSYFTILFSL